jgi:hypothetical protein
VKKKSLHPKWMAIMDNYKGRALAPIDAKILKFIWKWKLATAAVLFENLGAGHKVNSFNKRLKKLQRNKMIFSHFDIASGFWTWELSEFGFYAIRESLGPIKDHGFRSAGHHHDRLVQVFQMGDWASYPEAMAEHVTDQELLRYPQDHWLSWVPKFSGHRPDGYTRVVAPERPLIYAIEVELTSKSLSRYTSTIRWYQLVTKIDKIFWLVDDPFVVTQIAKAITAVREKAKNLHLFIDLREFEKNGWDSVVNNERSERVDTLRGIMRRTTGPECGNYAENRGTGRRGTYEFDQRKFVGIQTSYGILDQGASS